MPHPDESDRLATSAATTLVHLMWPEEAGATWDAVQQWFARMWAAGNPVDEKEVRRQLRAGPPALASRDCYQRYDRGRRRSVNPDELVAHWTRAIAAALAEGRFSAAALSAFVEEFRVPAEVGRQMMRTERELERWLRTAEDRRSRHGQIQMTLAAENRELRLQESKEQPEQWRQTKQSIDDEVRRRSEASQRYKAARSESISAAHRAEVYQRQHAQGRRGQEEVDEALRQQREAEERLVETKAELDRVDEEIKKAKQRRRAPSDAAVAVNLNTREAQEASTALEREMAEAEQRVRDIEPQCTELRRSWEGQNRFYLEKANLHYHQGVAESNEAHQRRLLKERREQADEMTRRRSAALQGPEDAAPPVPPSPEVEQWLRTVRDDRGDQGGDPPPPTPPSGGPPEPPSSPGTPPTSPPTPDVDAWLDNLRNRQNPAADSGPAEPPPPTPPTGPDTPPATPPSDVDAWLDSLAARRAPTGDGEVGEPAPPAVRDTPPPAPGPLAAPPGGIDAWLESLRVPSDRPADSGPAEPPPPTPPTGSDAPPPPPAALAPEVATWLGLLRERAGITDPNTRQGGQRPTPPPQEPPADATSAPRPPQAAPPPAGPAHPGSPPAGPPHPGSPPAGAAPAGPPQAGLVNQADLFDQYVANRERLLGHDGHNVPPVAPPAPHPTPQPEEPPVTDRRAGDTPDPNATTVRWSRTEFEEAARGASSPPPEPDFPEDPEATVRFRPEWMDRKPNTDDGPNR